MTKIAETPETIAQKRLTELNAAFEMTLQKRESYLDNLTVLEHLAKVGEDTISAFGLHKRAMVLTKHGIEIVKVQFDEDRVQKKIEKMKRDPKLSRETIPFGTAQEILNWIRDYIQSAISQIAGELEYRRNKLAVASSVSSSLLGSLGQEYAEFALTAALWPMIFQQKEIQLPHWDDLAVTVQDYARGLIDAIGELEEAYGIYMVSEPGSLLTGEEASAIAQTLSGTISLLHEYLDEFSSYDDNVMRNTPNATVGIDREDREAIRKMNTPLRLRMKGIASAAARLRDMFLSKRDLSRATAQFADTTHHTDAQRTA